MPAADPALTDALADRYRLLTELGAGGMATVYRALDLRHDREVAVKVLHRDLAASLGAERFLVEIRTTARLQHPHILPLLDSGEAGGALYYVMPLAPGESLRAKLERERQLPIPETVRLIGEVASALTYAHRAGVVHRDIKPENILLQDGRAVVADFGIALAVTQAAGPRLTQSGISLGTPSYMSPEQAMGDRAVNARSDVYALGVVAYELLTGEPPFTGGSMQSVVARILTERPRAPSTMRDTVPPAMDEAVLQALATLPADRFADATAFAEALASSLSGASAAAARLVSGPQGAPGARQRSRRGPGVMMAAVGVLGIAVGVVVGRGAGKDVGTPAVYDVAMPDSLPLDEASALTHGFGWSPRAISVDPQGEFVVYPAPQDSSTQLWRRSLLDDALTPIRGTTGGTTPRVSPDGRRLAFVVGARTVVVPVEGGRPTVLLERDVPQTLEWVSPTRLLATTHDGKRLLWIDVDPVRVTPDSDKPPSFRCLVGHWIATTNQLLCSGASGAVTLTRLPQWDSTRVVQQRGRGTEPGTELTNVSGARLVGDRYLLWLDGDGTLTGARIDLATAEIGPPVSLVRGIRLDVMGRAQLDLDARGTLVFATGGAGSSVRLVQSSPGRTPEPLLLETAAYERIDLRADGRALAAVVKAAESFELRLYDLRSGARQVLLRAPYINQPLWSPDGSRLAVAVRDANGWALLHGDPTRSGGLDTVLRMGVSRMVVSDYPGTGVLLAQTDDSRLARIDLGANVRVDTLPIGAVFPTRAPGGRLLAWYDELRQELYAGPYPLSGQQHLVAEAGFEPLWLSSTELLYRMGNRWLLATLDAASGEPVSAPRLWGRDPRFVDTPGWSNRTTHDGGILYAQSLEADVVRSLRVIPGFSLRLQAAVGAVR